MNGRHAQAQVKAGLGASERALLQWEDRGGSGLSFLGGEAE